MARILNILVPAFLTEYGRLSFESSQTENFSEAASVYDKMTTTMSLRLLLSDRAGARW